MARTPYPANRPFQYPPPVGGLNAISAITHTPIGDALALENFVPYPDKIVTRDGASDHATGFANPLKRLHVYAAQSGVESLWATTDAGVYNATSAGAVGAAVIALTSGKTNGVSFNTGAGTTYMFLVNGVDTMKQYDGAAWTSVAVLGATNTQIFSFVESYRQRLFFIERNSLNVHYLAANAIAGAPTAYTFASLFRRGGYLVALGTWTVDGGAGPDDLLVMVTSQGELAVFNGNDPATWSLAGVYYIGRPLGQLCLFKYGGDLLYLSEAGLYPLSKSLLAASIDRTQAISDKIRPLFNAAASSYFANDGWQVIAQPDIPLLICNIPGSSTKFQYAMHLKTGAWTVFSGWDAVCFARMGGNLYFGTGNKVAVVGASSDFGANITSTMLSAYSMMGYARKKHIRAIRPYFNSNGSFTFTLGCAQDFVQNPNTTSISPLASATAALWGSGIWGTAVWTSSSQPVSDFRVVPDIYSTWKAIYLQIVSNTAQISYLGSDLRLMFGSDY